MKMQKMNTYGSLSEAKEAKNRKNHYLQREDLLDGPTVPISDIGDQFNGKNPNKKKLG